ncbi:MAG: localization factor PodJL, partial [Variibacter sp.]|nr:localization factor PodJL [Variibacter sp.]
TSKVAPLEFEVIKQDIEGLRDLHAESERRTQHTLEGVHNTLVRLVDRVAALDPSGSPMAVASGIGSAMPGSGMHSASEFGSSRALLGAQPAANGMQERRPIDPSLPADHPLEPGSATSGRPSAGERIAASEAALASLKPAAAPEGDARANFIAAARRAAQAAARVSAGVPEGSDEEPQARRGLAAVAQRLSRRRPLMLGCALIVLAGTLHLVLNVVGVNEPDLAKLTSGEAPREKPKATVVKLPAQSSVASTSPTNAKPAKDTSAEPAPSALPSQPAQEAGPTVFPQQESRAIPAVSPLTVASIQLPGIADVTGSVSRATGTARSASASSEAAATNGMLPAGFSEGLKLAASQGNPAAAYEVAIRYAEGRGVQANLEEAVRWLDRAAAQGVAPAQYRLGSMYEKGQGVKKDLEQARKLYRAAADKGSAKAMHNLAVLYAEGIDGKPDFAAAGQWFRKAAERGVSDSQYNLGILYARGLGVEQNLPESYKWLALASQKNDADAGRKRDDIASRLDLPSLAAAKAAAEAFRPEPQPEEATTVAAPPGGWDAAIAPSAKAKTATQPRRIIAQ